MKPINYTEITVLKRIIKQLTLERKIAKQEDVPEINKSIRQYKEQLNKIQNRIKKIYNQN